MSRPPRTSRATSKGAPAAKTTGGRVPDAVRVTVLGKSPGWQDAGGACSGYLVEEDGVRVLLDCGNGVFAKLRRHVDYADVDAVVLSHLHADHFLDLVPFSYALRYAPASSRCPRAGRRPALHAPPGARERSGGCVGAWGSEDLIEGAFDLREYDPAEVLHAGPLTRPLPARPALRPGQRDRGHVRAAAVASPSAPTAGRPTSCARSRATPTCS